MYIANIVHGRLGQVDRHELLVLSTHFLFFCSSAHLQSLHMGVWSAIIYFQKIFILALNNFFFLLLAVYRDCYIIKTINTSDQSH